MKPPSTLNARSTNIFLSKSNNRKISIKIYQIKKYGTFFLKIKQNKNQQFYFIQNIEIPN